MPTKPAGVGIGGPIRSPGIVKSVSFRRTPPAAVKDSTQQHVGSEVSGAVTRLHDGTCDIDVEEMSFAVAPANVSRGVDDEVRVVEPLSVKIFLRLKRKYLFGCIFLVNENRPSGSDLLSGSRCEIDLFVHSSE